MGNLALLADIERLTFDTLTPVAPLALPPRADCARYDALRAPEVCHGAL